MSFAARFFVLFVLFLPLLTACNTPVSAPLDAQGDVDATRSVTSVVLEAEQEVEVRTGRGLHFAFPDVARLRDGTLLVVYREGATHVDPSGRIMLQTGSADALSWGAPRVLVDTPNIDDRDPSVTVLANGDVLVNWFQYLPQGNLTVHHVFTVRSRDNAMTFDPVEQVDPGAMTVAGAQIDSQNLWTDANGSPVIVQASSSAIVPVGDQWMLPAYGGNALNLASLSSTPRSRLTIYRKSSSSSAWVGVPIAPQLLPNVWLMEPALLRLDDGSLLLQVRTANGASPSNAGNLLQAVSTDQGQTFSNYKDLGFIGHAPELLQLSHGVVLSAFRYLDNALRVETVDMMTSLDRGVSWSPRITILDCGGVECGYPGLLELDGNRLLVVYYTPGGRGINSVIYRVQTN